MVREHIECLLKLICPSPSDISVTAVHGERTTIFKIDCSQKNIGRVLGKGGQNINGLRKFILAITSNHGFRSIVEVPYHPIDV
ncbi:KH domain-containing protein [Bdellovibrio sp.]|uniref:KH domain-containing protein n=1 Tax=Bdellovibrio sp. TaxID=28201 RepID=UPI0039E71F53